MDLANLSSNWKRLQAALKNGEQPKKPKKELKRPRITGSNSTTLNDNRSYGRPPAAQQLKRKLPEEATKSSPARDHTAKQRKMGAYVSSLPTSSYALTPNPIVPTVSKPAQSKPPSEVAAVPVHVDIPANIIPNAQAGKYLSIDCEMVGTHSLTPFSTPAHKQFDSMRPEYSILSRVSIVTYALEPLYDAYVLPPPDVSICDYRTPYSGMTPWHLTPGNATTNPEPFDMVQREVAELLKNRILVGHALKNDLAVLGLSHPRCDIRDTARHPAFRALAGTTGKDGKPGKGRTPSLKKLSQEVLGLSIQGDEKRGHSSIEDARAAMALFRKEKRGFEKEAMKMFGNRMMGGRTGSGVKMENVSTHMMKKGAAIGEESEEEDDVGADDNENEGSIDDGLEGDNESPVIGGHRKKRKAKRKKRTKR